MCLQGIKSKLVPGTSLLIHGGAGAVGQAAISIALANGCKVFTTVSDQNKKTLLKNLFPELPGWLENTCFWSPTRVRATTYDRRKNRDTTFFFNAI